MIYRIALCTLLLTACTPEEPKAPVPKLFEQSRNTLDQAKSVETMQMKQAEEQQKLIEKQSQ